jgi:hypothetical protein
MRRISEIPFRQGSGAGTSPDVRKEARDALKSRLPEGAEIRPSDIDVYVKLGNLSRKGTNHAAHQMEDAVQSWIGKTQPSPEMQKAMHDRRFALSETMFAF